MAPQFNRKKILVVEKNLKKKNYLKSIGPCPKTFWPPNSSGKESLSSKINK
jgi:hypothetical protein